MCVTKHTSPPVTRSTAPGTPPGARCSRTHECPRGPEATEEVTNDGGEEDLPQGSRGNGLEVDRPGGRPHHEEAARQEAARQEAAREEAAGEVTKRVRPHRSRRGIVYPSSNGPGTSGPFCRGRVAVAATSKRH